MFFTYIVMFPMLVFSLKGHPHHALCFVSSSAPKAPQAFVCSFQKCNFRPLSIEGWGGLKEPSSSFTKAIDVLFQTITPPPFFFFKKRYFCFLTVQKPTLSNEVRGLIRQRAIQAM